MSVRFQRGEAVNADPSLVLLLREGISGLVRTRRHDLEEWVDALGLDAVGFLPLPTWSRRLGPRAAGADDGWREGIG